MRIGVLRCRRGPRSRNGGLRPRVAPSLTLDPAADACQLSWSRRVRGGTCRGEGKTSQIPRRSRAKVLPQHHLKRSQLDQAHFDHACNSKGNYNPRSVQTIPKPLPLPNTLFFQNQIVGGGAARNRVLTLVMKTAVHYNRRTNTTQNPHPTKLTPFQNSYLIRNKQF